MFPRRVPSNSFLKPTNQPSLCHPSKKAPNKTRTKTPFLSPFCEAGGVEKYLQLFWWFLIRFYSESVEKKFQAHVSLCWMWVEVSNDAVL